ncbi:hypothetical protein OSTOST_02423 [Ostertagia ostertagi]
MMAFVCISRKEQRDSSKDTLFQLITFVSDVTHLIKDARMGLISVGCPASTSIPIGSYTMTEFTHLLNSLKYPNGKPEMFAAFNLARDLIYLRREGVLTLFISFEGKHGHSNETYAARLAGSAENVIQVDIDKPASRDFAKSVDLVDDKMRNLCFVSNRPTVDPTSLQTYRCPSVRLLFINSCWKADY